MSAEMYALDVWESFGPRCPHCSGLVSTGGSWRRLGERKTRRAIVNLANRALSSGFSYRIQEKHPVEGWRNGSMRGVRGYGD